MSAQLRNEWDQKIAKDGRKYYVNHITKKTSWDIGLLPDGWSMQVDNGGRVYFFSVVTGMTTYIDPRRAPPSLPAAAAPPKKPKMRRGLSKGHLSNGAKALLDVRQKHLSGEISAQQKQQLKAALIAQTSASQHAIAYPVRTGGAAVATNQHAIAYPISTTNTGGAAVAAATGSAAANEADMMRRAIEESIRAEKELAQRREQQQANAQSEEERLFQMAVEASKTKNDIDVLTKWVALTDSSGIEIKDGVFQEHCKQANEYDEQIWRDVPRTFQEKPECNTDKWRQSLFRILHAIPCHLDVGYVQGMNFLGGVLLNSTGDEEKSFWLLVRMIKGRKYGMEGLFMDGLPRVFAAGFQVSESMKRVMPQLADHLEKNMLNPTAWLPQWILTLFAKREGLIGAELLQRMWTLFFRDGWNAILNISLTMLQMCERKVLEMSFDQALVYLTEGIWSDLDWNELCERCGRTQVVSDEDLEMLEVAYIEVQEKAAREEEEFLKQREIDLKEAEAAAAKPAETPEVEKVLSSAKSFFMNLVKPLLVEQRRKSKEKNTSPMDALADSGYDGLFGLSASSPPKKAPKKPYVDKDKSIAIDDDDEDWEMVVSPTACSDNESAVMEQQLNGLEVLFYLSRDGGKTINTDFFGAVLGNGEGAVSSIFIVEMNGDGSVCLRNKATGFYLSVTVSVTGQKTGACCNIKSDNSRLRLRPYSGGSIGLEFLAAPQKFLAISRHTRKSRLSSATDPDSHFYLVPQ